ncbi:MULTISPECIES: GntR family transcriptional regulator [unclassified Undibacterium]|uniref:GntR family transcriptional regulator n=1 Tax=unclassified Undibacterium TaxID=2630295 RepID=UPI002AC91311|nr:MULTISPECIES: GntR family transcriptional regulator [unclassified Undibacterium]MEB0137448.1 GntR family transcriptional regulator [Undibacterium sp. CCC2.1]MEB0170887.1 GntR family transcriptional regulator [Undibacterium sp. CCC1.1]MEB0174839.1 GntR family transcriptional regulator [Undibacterium sp. CCC3.4]MEB0214175.1 GntR family transcriptional regulator [Undibacterium sp. 5I2]WPX44487.1 GntR family transcriptional regulator [Undibacterium sp. CCC3.4]
MKNRSTTLREEIEEMIAMGKLPPGQHLDETELAGLFGVSRTPIREALIQLASMGLVDMRPRRGAYVATVDAGQLVEMFEVMAEFEAMCGRMAARRMSKPEQLALKEAHQACQEAADSADADAYFYQNEIFHSLIYSGSHNSFLASQANNLHRRLRPYRRLQLRVRDRVNTSFHEHDEVVQAILAGDADRAALLLRAHITIQGERFADLIAALPR